MDNDKFDIPSCDDLWKAAQIMGVKNRSDTIEAVVFDIIRRAEVIHKNINSCHAISLAESARKLNDNGLEPFVQAMLHEVCGIKPTIQKLGYEVAEEFKSDKPEVNDKYREIIREFDLTNYVFSHTHYDECSNGFFFRRS